MITLILINVFIDALIMSYADLILCIGNTFSVKRRFYCIEV